MTKSHFVRAAGAVLLAFILIGWYAMQGSRPRQKVSSMNASTLAAMPAPAAGEPEKTKIISSCVTFICEAKFQGLGDQSFFLKNDGNNFMVVIVSKEKGGDVEVPWTDFASRVKTGDIVVTRYGMSESLRK